VKALDAALERRLRRAVRREIAASPELREREREARKALRNRAVQLPFGLFGPFLFFLLPAFLAVNGALAEVSLLAGGLVTTSAAFWLAANFSRRVWASPENVVWGHLPVGDDTLFRFHARDVLRRAAWLPLGPAIFFAAWALFLGKGFGGAAWGAAIGLAQGAATLAAGVAISAWKPRLRTHAPAVLLLVLILPLVKLHDGLEATLRGSYGAHLAFLPTTWGGFAARGFLLYGNAAALAGTAACALFGAVGVFSVRSLRRRFWLDEVQPFAASVAEPVVEAVLARASEETRREFPERMDAWVRTRAFLGPMVEPGRLERFFYRRLTPRERDVAALLLPEPPLWTARWKMSLVLTVAALPLILWPGGGAEFRMLAAALPLLPMLGGRFPAFDCLSCGGIWLPIHASLPIGYAESVRILCKAALLRVGSILPFLLVVGAALACKLRLSPAGGLLFGLKAAFLLVALQPAMAAFRFLSGSETAFRVTWGSLTLLFPPILALVAVIVAGLGISFHPRYGIAGLLAVAAASLLLCLYVGAYLTRGRADWGRLTRPEG